MNIPSTLISSILKTYGLDTSFSEQEEYLYFYKKYGYNVKAVFSVLLQNKQRVVIKIVNIEHNDFHQDTIKTENQSTFSELLRHNGIVTPKYYMANGKYCNQFVCNDFPCNVTVEDWCGEEITEITTDLSYKIGELTARMHVISLNNNASIGFPTIWSAITKNDADAYEDFCEICKNENLNQTIVKQIIKHRNAKLQSLLAVWDDLPKTAVQGDISINNLTLQDNVLTVFDYNCAGDEVLVSDLVLEGLLTAYEMELPEGADPSIRQQLFPAFLNGYLSVRQLSKAEADAAWTIYTMFTSLWFSKICYTDNSLENLVNKEDYSSANKLLTQILADLTRSNDGRFIR